MIVDEGKIQLLGSEITYLQTLDWGLFSNNIPDSPANNWGTFTGNEAGWSGYVRQVASVWSAPSVPIAGGVAISNSTPLPVFLNTSAVPVTFYGWALIDVAGNRLIAMTNIGLQTIPAGSAYILQPSLTDNQL